MGSKPFHWATIKRVVVEQYGGWWSMPLDTWITLCRDAIAAGGEYDLSRYAPELRNKPRAIGTFHESRRDGDYRHYHSRRPEVLLVQPLDWDEEAFREHLEDLAEQINQEFLAPAFRKLEETEQKLGVAESRSES